MTLISQKLAGLLNGVSQKPDQIRPSSQAAVQENCLSHRIFGLRRRPPTTHIAKVGDIVATAPPAGGGGFVFPMLSLMGLYDADLGVTTTPLASSNHGGYAWLQADAPYVGATVIADQSGNGNGLSLFAGDGAMVRSNIISGHKTICGPGAGNSDQMNCTAFAGAAMTQLTMFAVMRPSYVSHTTVFNEFVWGLSPGSSSFIALGTQTGSIGATTETSTGTLSHTAYGSGWTGDTSLNTPFDIVVFVWDGTSITAYKNGLLLSGSQPFPSVPYTVQNLVCRNDQMEWTTWGWWGRALSGLEIHNIFHTMGPKYGITVF